MVLVRTSFSWTEFEKKAPENVGEKSRKRLAGYQVNRPLYFS